MCGQGVPVKVNTTFEICDLTKNETEAEFEAEDNYSPDCNIKNTSKTIEICACPTTNIYCNKVTNDVICVYEKVIHKFTYPLF